MAEFLGEQIEVLKDEKTPRPISFKWHGEVHTIVEILEEWVDTGFGQLPYRSRKWYNRRHRRYYVVRDSAGCVFEIYHDYSNRKNQTWWLTKRK
ncbi:MAG: DUF6504 family protein [Armatimonadota bacterium]|nr:DUF6504 family protein [Armatimonadota bacterium]